ncbi:lipocalin family protein [Aquimarina aquimarini]|uniref:lipocalin family protein n=1 Tax=Aquimarina aquimarini TaxID=1191734 RepID=UPI000D54AFFE|nr:lipocalin family protein [Aquimarina aquimarini]
MNQRLNTYFLYSTLIISIFTSCSKNNPKNYTQYLNGYWEIKKVIMPNGNEKEYKFNQNIDFFQINDTSGIRKKVRPKFDGSFTTTGTSETFTLRIKNDSLRLYYKTSFATWVETVISAEENEIVIKNETGNVYFYQRYQKIEL